MPSCLSAISGGVDSSVATSLLVDSGYDVECVTLDLIDDPTLISSAEKVAAAAGVPFRVVNMRGQFEKCVMDKFANSYLRGLTPNPCIDCNKHLKFGALHELRKELGFDFLATGHYARIVQNEETGRFELLRGQDLGKDQSYFLYNMTQDELAHTLFPLGHMTKQEVREVAGKHSLPSATSKESQDICFIPDGDYVNFIRRHNEVHEGEPALMQPGPIEDAEGSVLGEHTGIAMYTIGQRKGIGIAAKEPLYVIGKDADRNALVVGAREELMTRNVVAEDVNFVSVDADCFQRPGLNDASSDDGILVRAKTSYRQAPTLAKASFDGMRLRVAFEEEIMRPSPGQALVVYDAKTACKVLAGGTIF